MSARLSESEEWAIVDRIRAGQTTLAIAAEMQLARDTVSRTVRRFGLSHVVRLPAPSERERDTSWRDLALCRPELEPVWHEKSHTEQVGICHGCPVTAKCLAFGLRQDIPARPDPDWPIWGGLTGPEQHAEQTRARREKEAERGRRRREARREDAA